MGFFSKRNTAAAADTTTATGSHHREKKAGIFGSKNEHGGARAWNSRPTFGAWIKATALDIVTMAILGAIGLGVYFADPAPSRSFPVTFRDGEIVYPQFAYPLRNEIIPIWAAALMAFFIPFAVFLICQIRVRSFWDVNNATIGFRPHFLAVCKPVIPANLAYDTDTFESAGPTGTNVANGFRAIMFDRSICTGDKKEINDALESMPSGHTTAAFAGFVFLYLYLNAKLKVFANYHPAMWKLAAIYAPLLGACLIGGALTIDEFHNWYDVAAGAVIGSTMAFSSYRMVYASVWDFRFNHIPVLRHAPFVYGAGPSSFDGFHDAVWTRKAGWGLHDSSAWSGAPFDAADGPRGTMAPQAEGPMGSGAGPATGSHLQRKPVGGNRFSHEHGHRGEQMV
ncbi:hypothetical protein OPT61_g6606 [Boeremia exigua]|uniref:Uncharacterized protein n=1 Tax=Boeremia exigua TaxID=749465 RepID=A0ACC2I5P7_9PLEO|nr:hypothetical protein OPT61_g6606 [Boeremia exigua]